MKIAYLPAILLLIGVKVFAPFLVMSKLRISVGIFAFPKFVRMWWNHVEEWWNRKPLLQATADALLYENGGRLIAYPWKEITGVVLFRRIAPWRPNGQFRLISPPFWLSIQIASPKPLEIIVWPGEISGGLFALFRFAKIIRRNVEVVANGK